MQIEVGAILESKFDMNIEHAVVLQLNCAAKRGSMTPRILIETVKSKTRALITEDELARNYNIIGQSETGKVLYGID